VALAGLAAQLADWGWPWIDAQVENEHTLSLGSERIPRQRFLWEITRLVSEPAEPGDWTTRFQRRLACGLA